VRPEVRDLKKILGETYGGPSLSVEDDQWVIYNWADAPVNTEIMARGETLAECIRNYKKRKEKK